MRLDDGHAARAVRLFGVGPEELVVLALGRHLDGLCLGLAEEAAIRWLHCGGRH